MKSILLHTSLLILVFAILTPTAIFPQTVGRVKGNVITLAGTYEAVVTNIQVIFESEGKKYQTTTNDIGEYNIELPIGIYKITTSQPGFCHYQRAFFRVPPSSQTVINLIVYACALANIIKINDKGEYIGEECRYVDTFTNETIQLRSQNIESNILFVRYGEKEAAKDSVIYRGAKINNGEYLGAMASYDVLTIYADTIRFNKNTLHLHAEGNVRLEDGNQQHKIMSVEIDFKSKDPLSHLKKQ